MSSISLHNLVLMTDAIAQLDKEVREARSELHYANDENGGCEVWAGREREQLALVLKVRNNLIDSFFKTYGLKVEVSS